MTNITKFKAVFEFDSEEQRDDFLGWFCDGGGEDSYGLKYEYSGQSMPQYSYKKAFPAWGWDGKGDPTVEVKN